MEQGRAHSPGDLLHERIKLVLRLETDARPLRQTQPPVTHDRVVGKSSERAEDAGVRFAAAKAEAADDVQRHLIAPVGEDGPTFPAVALEHLQRARELDDAIRLWNVDLNAVPS